MKTSTLNPWCCRLLFSGLAFFAAPLFAAPAINFSPLTNAAVVADLSSLGGTVQPDVGTITNVSCTIREVDLNGGTGRWWNGATWQGADMNLLATMSGTNWSPNVALPALNSGLAFELTAKVFDNTGASNGAVITVYSLTNTLAWDPGLTHPGTAVLNNPNTNGGSYVFRIVTSNTVAGAWRTALNVTAGEADVYLYLGTVPTTNSYQFKSDRVGSDGFVLHSSQFSPAQEWYVLVQATPGARWNLVSGEAFVLNLGTLATNGTSSTNVAMGAEGMRFFKTTVPSTTKAWRLWLNGSLTNILVKKSVVPHPISSERSQAAQMLVVPPYLDGNDSTVYIVGAQGVPGQNVNLDSRQQAITVLTFDATNSVSVTGYGYRTYRVQVPVSQIAWEMNAVPVSGDPSFAVRRNDVPNEFDNDAYSEAPGAAADSVTLVPPLLSDGTFYITTYALGAHSFTLVNRRPELTTINFTDSKLNADTQRTGWRYYRITDIAQQLGQLGWYLYLVNQPSGTELAMRRNTVPGRWRYRANGVNGETAYEDFFNPDGFLQRPGHQADIWYVGVYQPDTNLGAFTLVTQPLTNDFVAFSSGAKSRVNVPAGLWEYFRVDVPANALGWDLRLVNVASSSQPYMEVRRGLLPDLVGNAPWTYPWASTTWPSGYEWLAGLDWTGYPNTTTGASETTRTLAMGIGNPLEPATYYVGIYGAATASYTLQSRSIGDGFDIPVKALNYSGGSTNRTGLAPREADYYKVVIASNTPSWELRLTTTAPGETMLLVQRDALPNVVGGGQSAGGIKLQKLGAEHFVLLPDSLQTSIAAGIYYLAVVSEGENPVPATGRAGANNVSYLLESLGPLTTNNLGVLPSVGGGELAQTNTLAAGSAKAYQFTVQSNTLSLEVQLTGRTGNPVLALRADGQFPADASGDGYGVYGGQSAQYVQPADTRLLTIPNPATGTYTVLVKASRNVVSGFFEDAGYTLRVRATGPLDIAFDGGTTNVAGQAGDSWRFFRVVVPTNALGWDARLLNVTQGSPRLVIRRALLPEFVATYPWDYPYVGIEWPSNYQWAASIDWTSYPNSSAGTNEIGRILATGMGNPLEPGMYYLGVTGDGIGTNLLSYTVQSRGIGDGHSIGVTEIGFDSAPTNRTGLAAREAAYFKVVIASNTPSWRLRLGATAGETMLLIHKGALPNVNDGRIYSTGFRMEKTGNENFLMLPLTTQTNIEAGTYYLAVVGEGDAPTNNNIGVGTSDYSLQSRGTNPVIALGTLGAIGAPDLTNSVALEFGQVAAYQFTVPAGAFDLQMELVTASGIAVATMRPGTSLPTPGDAYGQSGGEPAFYLTDSLLTVSNPATGIYSVTVEPATTLIGNVTDDASVTLHLRAVSQPVAVVSDLNFDGGAASVTNQSATTWTYFKVIVPANAAGWDVRLVNVTGGYPQMTVRRDALPTFAGTYPSWFPWAQASWPSSNQWSAGLDWTARPNDSAGLDAHVNMLAMGMGNPLEPGTNYIGVTGGGSGALTYTIQSRGIGDGFTIPISPLNFSGAGSSVSTNGLAAREAAYYRLTIPSNTPSWHVDLTPSASEALLLIQKDFLPNVAASTGPATVLTGGKKMQKPGNEHYYLLPAPGQTNIPAGNYFLAVVSEGVNPAPNNIGTGGSDYTLASLGVMTAQNLGALNPPGGADVTQAASHDNGEVKLYQFTAPTNAFSFEVRLADRSGNPAMTLRNDAQFPSGYDYGLDGGQFYQYADAQLITAPNPVAGTWSLLVQANADGNAFPGASYTLHLRQHPVPTLNFSSNLNTNGGTNVAAGNLQNHQSAYFKIIVPATNNGEAVLGWKLDLSQISGTPQLRVSQDTAPQDYVSGTTAFVAPAATIVPTFLTPGNWFAEVRGGGNTEFTLTSSQLLLQRPAWNMPAAGQPVTTTNLPSSGPLFADTGINTNGQALGGDNGIDLAQGNYHYYAVNVPSNNVGLLRLQLDAISGNPDVYARFGLAPTATHRESGAAGAWYDRAMTGLGTEYANWVPLNGRYEKFLTPGAWYFAVYAAGNSNVRYRLRASTGSITNLSLGGGSATNQLLAAGDWRYYRVQIPTNAPRNWTVTFNELFGDVVMYVRDITPPGDGISDWTSDYKNGGPYGNFDVPAANNFTTPPLRPGSTYYLGFRAVGDAAFAVSSSTNGGIGVIPELNFAHGRVTNTLAPFSQATYRIFAPAGATRWVYSSTHNSAVQLFIEQGTLPQKNAAVDHFASVSADSSLDTALYSNTGWPWLNAQSYYLTATNSSAAPQTLFLQLSGVIPALVPPAVVLGPEILPGGHFHAGYTGTPDASYTVQFAPEVTGPWTSLTNGAAGTDGLFEFEDPTEPLAPMRFYRLTSP